MILDSVTIRSGYADGSGDDATGGGALVDGSVTFVQCDFLYNAAYVCGDTGQSRRGGAIAGTDGPVKVYNSRFVLNNAEGGGAISVPATTDTSEIVNCVFHANAGPTGNDGGGAIRAEGIQTTAEPTVHVDNCSSWWNHGFTGGFIWAKHTDVVITNSILWGSTKYGGGLYPKNEVDVVTTGDVTT